MKISFDPAKRVATLRERRIDFIDAEKVFDGPIYTQEDMRFAYPETRYVTAGLLDGRMVIIVWTPRGTRHVISMGKANDREQKRYRDRLG
ncbi:MAG TPA: BrnT family toxin [Stellaceae bacterium]|nr:BrnT family toxin [Stellaceae bacterium]